MRKTKEQWEYLFNKYESGKWDWEDYYDGWSTNHKKESVDKLRGHHKKIYRIRQSKYRFLVMYRKWKIDHNSIMRKTKNKQRTKEEIAEVVSQLTQKELEDIAKYHLEHLEKEKNKDAGAFDWSISRKAFVFNISRSGLYKKKKERMYKFDYIRIKISDTTLEGLCFIKSIKYEDKIKVLKQLESGRLRRSVACEFYYSHLERYGKNNIPIILQLRRIERLFMDWELLRDNWGMERLKQTQGNRNASGPKGKRKTNINDLDQNDREIYQKIVEDILKKHKIPKSEITKRIQEEKENINNVKDLSGVFGINRSNIYYKKTKTKKVFSYDPKLIKDILELIMHSKGSIGRDKSYMTLKRKYPISTYCFRRHWESLNYISSYRKKYRRAPIEKKYKGVWTSDKVDFNFKCSHEDEVWFSDITYVKIGNEYLMVLLIIDGFTKKLKYLKIIENRKSETIIKAMKEARRNAGAYPDIFHSDHGIEYANYKFKNFLKRNKVIQSMSPKGNHLANRPCEFFFSSLKREFIYPYAHEIKTPDNLARTLKEYKNWYHKVRVQSCLAWKTPQEMSLMAQAH